MTAKAELEQSIDVARSEVNRLDSIVTQFLKAIRPSRPQLRPENVNTIVEEAVRFFAPEIQDRDIVVEQELRSDLPLLQLDRDQMKQAFYNVIKNSLEAMNRHGTLRIRTDLDDTHVDGQFVDTGGGMSAENLSHVFEPYFTTKPSGTGLGLLIVRRIVREHGGELSIESSQGKGLTLTIRLPYVDKRIRMLEAGKPEPECRLQEPLLMKGVGMLNARHDQSPPNPFFNHARTDERGGRDRLRAILEQFDNARTQVLPRVIDCSGQTHIGSIGSRLPSD